MAAHVLTQQIIAHALRDGARVRQAVLERCLEDIAEAATIVAEATAAGRKVLLVGNGPSAADAHHVAAELVGRFGWDRSPVPAIALTLDAAALTAIGNDFGFEQVFARQVRALGQKDDVLLALTTTGEHANVIAAIEAARERGMRVVGLTSVKGRALAARCDACVAVPSPHRARVHELHVAIGHVICDIVEAHLLAREKRGAAVLRLVSDSPGAPPELAALGPAPSTDRLARSSKDVEVDELLVLRERWRTEGRALVWVTGPFEALRAAHVASLQAASRLGDVLVVGVETGPGASSADRVALLSALEAVDHVVVLPSPSAAAEIVRSLRPDVVARPEGAKPKPAAEDEAVRAYGGRIERIPAIPIAPLP